MQKFTVPIPLSLYIHIPWCVRKCPYCDFNSHEARHKIPEDEYVNALLLDFEEHLPLIWGRRLVSIFFGGGTPSLFSPHAIERLLLGIHARLPFHSDIEITLEANPGTVDEAHFTGFRQAGINRLSLGIQSLQDEKLKALGRIHNREYALRAIQAAKKAGFNNFNLDLMHGLPGQSIADALSDLRDALQQEPSHFSWYQLTIEPNTFFHYKPPVLPEEEILWDIQEQGKKILLDQGFNQYEVSAYSLPERQCIHNRNYWEFGDYLGIGAGAHSKLTDREQQVIHRYQQIKNPKDYLAQFTENPTLKKVARIHKILSDQDIRFEFLLNALRLNEGVSIAIFLERTGLTIEKLEPILSQAKSKKLLYDDSDKLQPTPLGLRFLNDLVGMFLE